MLRRHALDRGDAVAVEAELQDVRGLFGAGQLGVERLVAPRAEPCRPLDPQQEVRAPAPASIHERGLRDHLGARPHGLRRPPGRGLEIPGLAELDLDDGAALALQALEVRALVYLALAPQQVGFLVGDVRTRALAPRHLEGQGRQMRALDVVVQIRRRKKDVSVSALHGPDDDA